MKFLKSSKITNHTYYNNKFFEKWAPYYDIFEIVLGPLRSKATKLLDLPKGSKALDVATGTGSLAIAMAKEGFEVTGVDLSPDMLRQAKKKVKPDLKVTFHNLDATKLPFPSHSFDVVSISLGLHDMPPEIEQEVLSEMRRVAKKDGFILAVDYLEPSNHWIARLIHPILKKYETPNFRSFIDTGFVNILKKANISLSKRVYYLGSFQIGIGKFH